MKEMEGAQDLSSGRKWAVGDLQLDCEEGTHARKGDCRAANLAGETPDTAK